MCVCKCCYTFELEFLRNVLLKTPVYFTLHNNLVLIIHDLATLIHAHIACSLLSMIIDFWGNVKKFSRECHWVSVVYWSMTDVDRHENGGKCTVDYWSEVCQF